MLFFLDFAFRIYFSIRLFFKYWDAGSIKMPQVDIRLYREVKNPFKMSKGRLFILLFTNPIVGASMLGLVGVWILTFAVSVYTPLYTEYTNGCVPQQGNGTFLTSNVYSTAYNFAYQEGSRSLVKGIEKFDSYRSSTCSSMFTASTNKQNNDILQVDSFTNTLNTTNNHMLHLQTCLDTNQLDPLFQIACCGEAGYGECNNNNNNNNNNDTANTTKQYVCPMKRATDPPVAYSEPGRYFVVSN